MSQLECMVHSENESRGLRLKIQLDTPDILMMIWWKYELGDHTVCKYLMCSQKLTGSQLSLLNDVELKIKWKIKLKPVSIRNLKNCLWSDSGVWVPGLCE